MPLPHAGIIVDPAVSPDNPTKYGAKYPIVQCCEYKETVDLP